MSRTVRTPADKRKSYWRTEAGWARRMTRRQHRAQTNEAIRTERFDDVPARPRSTGGWITH